MSAWGCPHEIDGHCTKINDLACDPGMKGCVLHGRYRFANDDKNERFNEKRRREAETPAAEMGDAAGEARPAISENACVEAAAGPNRAAPPSER